MDWSFPYCVMEDADDVAALSRITNKVAANCSATNGQVLEATAILWTAFIECAGRNDAIMPKVADMIERMGSEKMRRAERIGRPNNGI